MSNSIIFRIKENHIVFLSVQFICSVVSHSLWPHGLQRARPPCSLPTPGVYSGSCPLSRWCHLTISSSVIPFPSCPPSFPASGSFPVSQFFASGGQSIGVSASVSVLPVNIQDCRIDWLDLSTEISASGGSIYWDICQCSFYWDKEEERKNRSEGN